MSRISTLFRPTRQRAATQSLVLFLITLLLGLCLAAPALATDPEEADPDPIGPPSTPPGTQSQGPSEEPAAFEFDPAIFLLWLQKGWRAVFDLLTLEPHES